MGNQRTLFYVIGTLAILIVGQMFFRYAYISDKNARVLRVDRLTGSSCYLPCIPPTPTPIPTATPTPIPRNYDLEDQQAIQKVKSYVGPYFFSTLNYAGRDSRDFKWSVDGRYTNEGAEQSTFDPYAAFVHFSPPPGIQPVVGSTEPPGPAAERAYPVRLVCYCDSKGWGVRWEVHLDTGDVFTVGDNATLMKKYGIPRH